MAERLEGVAFPADVWSSGPRKARRRANIPARFGSFASVSSGRDASLMPCIAERSSRCASSPRPMRKYKRARRRAARNSKMRV
jgi:hypothetical protein